MIACQKYFQLEDKKRSKVSQTWNHAAARPRFEMRRTGQSWRLVGRKYFPKIVVRKRVARKYCPEIIGSSSLDINVLHLGTRKQVLELI